MGSLKSLRSKSWELKSGYKFRIEHSNKVLVGLDFFVLRYRRPNDPRHYNNTDEIYRRHIYGTSVREVLRKFRLLIAEDQSPDIAKVRRKMQGTGLWGESLLDTMKSKLNGTNPGPPIVDETPWCASFIGEMIEKSSLISKVAISGDKANGWAGVGRYDVVPVKFRHNPSDKKPGKGNR